MKISLLTCVKGFTDYLGESKDFHCLLENYDFDLWTEDREIEHKFPKTSIILTMDEFNELLQSPLGKTERSLSVYDRKPNITPRLENLYTVGLTHAECTHVLFHKKW